MDRFKNILLVCEGNHSDKTAFRQASALAAKNEARLFIVRVLEGIGFDQEYVRAKMSAQEYRKFIVDYYMQSLKPYISAAEKKEIKVKTEILVGKPFVEVIRYGIHQGCDIIIKAAEGKSRMNDQIFGSLSLHLMRKSACPVWVLRPAVGRKFDRIVAAVDLDPDNPEEHKLNIKILDLASSLAAREQAKLQVVHAFTLFGEYAIRYGRKRISSRVVDEMVFEEKQKCKELLEELVRPYHKKVAGLQAHLIKGEAKESIPAFVRKNKADLLVMGTLARTGIQGFFIGNTAEDILQKVQCSVLTVKPEGFVSPIKGQG